MQDEMAQRPHKRTGVWLNETMKQKVPSESNLKRYSRDNVTAEDEGDTTHNNGSNFVDVIKNSIRSDLLKLPALNAWKNMNIGLLLTQFNEPDDVVQDDLPWNQDLLFTEVTNQLTGEKSSN